MKKALITLTDQILLEQQRYEHVTPGLSSVIHQIENAVKIIASHIKASGLSDIVGQTGDTNSFGEEVQKLDILAHRLLVERLLTHDAVYALVSEEEEEALYTNNTTGEYIVYFDPLDGSSNIDTNCPIGTIFSIYHKDDGLLQKGEKQLAAGYAIYGASVMFVYSMGDGVNGFTLDPAVGSFILSHPTMQVPKSGAIYSINEGYQAMFEKPIQHYLTALKEQQTVRLRFVGSLVADAHRTFIKGGIFLYPGYTNMLQGKLRLMLEVNPFAFLTEQAGGSTLAIGDQSPLQITPQHIHERAPFIMGSKENVAFFKTFLKP